MLVDAPFDATIADDLAFAVRRLSRFPGSPGDSILDHDFAERLRSSREVPVRRGYPAALRCDPSALTVRWQRSLSSARTTTPRRRTGTRPTSSTMKRDELVALVTELNDVTNDAERVRRVAAGPAAG